MQTRLFSAIALACSLAGIAAAASQPSTDDERRAAITVMRAINTAEHAVKRSTGKFVALDAILDHPAMARVRANIAADGTRLMHQGAQLRLALNQDALGYQVMVVPAATCGTAAFSDEGGMIYTGKVLDC